MLNKQYEHFLNSKSKYIPSSGIEVSPLDINSMLFDYQKDIVVWALKKGKSALFCGTGLGKTLMQLEWATHVNKIGKVLILAPLAVSSQTVREGEMFGIKVTHCYSHADVTDGINITNYERLDKFNANDFAGIVLDESSILKAQTGKIRTEIINKFSQTPYKLACTATPAPNDHTELGNHAEFLGICTATEMLATFFIHDGSDTSKWRLKGHAVLEFWKWVSSWAVMMTNPSDLGYDGSKFELPPLNIHQIVVETENLTDSLFAVEARTLQERQSARRDSIDDRVKACADLVNNSEEPWLIWCNLNSESELLKKLIINSVEVKGSDSPEHKEKSMIGFSDGSVNKLVSKASICGYGMNWQHCNKIAFVGLSDSFEQYYQAVRRCWRFGQTKQVDVYVITAETEGAVVSNIKRKEKDFDAMLKGMISATQEIVSENVKGTERDCIDYNPQEKMILPKWMEA